MEDRRGRILVWSLHADQQHAIAQCSIQRLPVIQEFLALHAGVAQIPAADVKAAARGAFSCPSGHSVCIYRRSKGLSACPFLLSASVVVSLLLGCVGAHGGGRGLEVVWSLQRSRFRPLGRGRVASAGGADVW